MLNPFRIIDPLMLTLKLRDSLRSGDNTHVQNYLQDTLVKSLSHSRNNANTSLSSMDTTQVNEHINSAVNQYLEQMKSMPGMGNYSGLQEYVEGIIRQSINQSLGKPLNVSANELPAKSQVSIAKRRESRLSEKEEMPEVFEAHDYILVRIQVPQNVHERNLRVYTSSNKVFIKWSPTSYEQAIQLPTDVKNEGVRAVIKNRILELTIPKEQNTHIKQVDIEYT